MSIFGWGNTEHGELGLGGIEEEEILEPREIPWKPEHSVISIGCGLEHTLFLTSDGKVYSCGCNDFGQLGHQQMTKRPQLINDLGNTVITEISGGARHSLALSEWGQLYSWGHNDYGQLAQQDGLDVVPSPKMIKKLATQTVIQIASGYNHSLALTNCGALYSWGSNIYGQLGVSPPSELAHATSPRIVNSLLGIPIAFIACGGNHSFIISKSGAVFGWGRNNSGQLGLNDTTHRHFPTQLRTIRSLRVRYIACGEQYSVFLTNDGGVFTCGKGSYGQLGHGGNMNEVLPRKVTELMGSTVTQISCGAQHTLALVPSRGRVYGFGLGCFGQFGTRKVNSCSLPQVMVGPWVSPSGSKLLNTETKDNPDMGFVIRQIFCGGNHSFVTTSQFIDNILAFDCRIYEPKTQIMCITSELAKQCAMVEKDSSIDLDLLTTVEVIFKSQACLNGSFLLGDKHFCCTSKQPGVDLVEVKQTFDYIRKVEHESLKQIIWDKITNEIITSLMPSPADVETLRLYLILPLYHEFVNSKNYENLHTPFSNAVLRLKEIPRKIVIMWWAQTPIEWFENLVSSYKNVVAHIISFKIAANSRGHFEKKLVTYNSNLSAALNLLVVLHRINHKERAEKIDYDIFHWPELTDYVDIQQDYIHWLFEKNPDTFNICNYPFLFNASAKTTLLQTDQAIQMHAAMQNAANSGILSLLTFGTPISQFIVLNVSRENLVQDTLREIMQYSQSDLKKPLKIKFHGEEAEDAGGVRKEFFMLLLRDLLDPKYGMFKEFEDSRTLWFADVTFETEDMYFLIGVICGLAIYNFIIINLPFPLALYKKLLDEPVDISDLRDISPALANSMESILNYNQIDFEEVFNLNFEISRDIFGEAITEELKPNGSQTAVTLENKKEFVDLYVDFIFNKAVENQFTAFRKGFMKVCWGRVLQIFKPDELMAVVVGNEEYDWQALELQCEYKNGYNSGDQTIRWFWEVFHDLPESEKKKFLLYLTGSDRIPIQGMKAIKICIQPTNDDRFLPVAHTCFNLLDLPRYNTKERLKYKLLQAIQQTQGFSLV
ncbi:probable E3 ubiquitin-protein ligase HERC4 [Rhagoletis pomonella]|uniref:probable E3 ubiquitin-protein ligase HERC4 n=1 Tax=Rhagoletis pomonella TaxID=28610 RepID=UPI00177EB04C|nr:probable E3 ubiquitin-protein ligase HERC4 [Rhagoletis pomonella]XP_036336675.1 probable E3 ubiquitin-protein ligase HERC4 [Rhagoletis pomonella]